MENNPYETPRAELISLPRQQSWLIATAKGWFIGSIVGAILGFAFIPVHPHVPSDKLLFGAIALFAVLGGAIARSLNCVPNSPPQK
jgi:hypothetical protein